MPSRLHACVPDDVIEDYEPLKLQLELTVGVFRQRLCFKPSQPEICIFVSINKQLEGTNLVEEQQIGVRHRTCPLWISGTFCLTHNDLVFLLLSRVFSWFKCPGKLQHKGFKLWWACFFNFKVKIDLWILVYFHIDHRSNTDIVTAGLCILWKLKWLQKLIIVTRV